MEELYNLDDSELSEKMREIDLAIGVYTPSEMRDAIIDELTDRGHLVIKGNSYHIIMYNAAGFEY